MIPDRNRRVGRSIYKLICSLFVDEIYNQYVKDNITITNVELTKDLKIAKIFFITKDNNLNKSVSELEKLKPFFKKKIADEINLKFCPDIIFQFDKDEDRANRVDDLINKLRKKNLL
jgi:ribosome-binding factor A